MSIQITSETEYEKTKAKMLEVQKRRKHILQKITRLKTKNGGFYPPATAALSKSAHDRLIEEIGLQDKLSQLSV